MRIYTCSLLGGIGEGGREGVVLDFGGGGEIISSVSSALPKEPSSMLAFEEPDQSNDLPYTTQNKAYGIHKA